MCAWPLKVGQWLRGASALILSRSESSAGSGGSPSSAYLRSSRSIMRSKASLTCLCSRASEASPPSLTARLCSRPTTRVRSPPFLGRAPSRPSSPTAPLSPPLSLPSPPPSPSPWPSSSSPSISASALGSGCRCDFRATLKPCTTRASATVTDSGQPATRRARCRSSSEPPPPSARSASVSSHRVRKPLAGSPVSATSSEMPIPYASVLAECWFESR
mmetsp:Transcript_36511/g.117990  ORF Transcript_36511/g.117990 Transcript_36511/m.117990 type:complete len:217 (+) Transcript_36511:193-843(+)